MVTRATSGELTDFVRERLAEVADPERATAIAAYMKSTMPCLGVGAKCQREVARDAARRFPPRDLAAYEADVLALWGLPHREEKHVAIAFARRFPTFVTAESIPLYDRLVREGAWWDFVDEIAVHLVGAALLKQPDAIWPVLDRWIDDEHMWIRRTAILCQMNHRERTDEARLFRYCLARCGESEFFIRKAIGWALRGYAYTAPDAVREFLLEHRHELSNLSVREAGKHIGVRPG